VIPHDAEMVMQILLEMEEVESLVREAMGNRGTQVPDKALMRIRQNHKKGTIRLVFTTPEKNGVPDPPLFP